MTGIISTYAFIFFVSQLSAPPFGAPSAATSSGQFGGAAAAASGLTGVSDGWKIDGDNTLTYIVQMSPQMATEIATRGEEIKIPIPTNLKGIAENVVIRIGNAPVERELTDEQLRSRQQQRARTDTRNAGITDLNSLSSRSSGGVVPIDPQRSPAAILPTGNTSAPARSTESDLAMQAPFGASQSLGSNRFGSSPSETLPPSSIPTNQQTLPPTVPPSFAQPSFAQPTFPQTTNGLNNSGSSQFSDGFNSVRNGLNQATNNSLVNSNGNSNQTNGVTNPSNFTNGSASNGSYAGTQASPYTGGSVTVLGSPSIDRIATNPYGGNQTATNPFGTTYGGGNNSASNPYAPLNNATNNWNNQSAFAQQQPLGPLNGQYGSQFGGQQQSPQYLPGSVPMPSLPVGLGNNPWSQDLRNGSSAYADSLRNNQQNTLYPPYDSNPTTLPPFARMAQSTGPLSNTNSPLSESKLREIALARELGVDSYGNPITTRQGRDTLSGLGQLLLVISLVGNAYLIWQISNLFNSYRTLQLSKRAEGSYSMDL